MDPVTAGALIMGGSSILGGMLGSRSVDRQTESNIAAQREFAQHGIRWRVEDAKAAGIHPLFAMQGGGAAFAPNPVVVDPMATALSEAGQNVGRAVAATETLDQKQLKLSQLKLLEAQTEKESAQAQYFRSQAILGGLPRDSDGIVQGLSNRPGEAKGPHAFYYDRYQVKPDSVVSRSSNNPESAAGVSPFWKPFEVMEGKLIDLPWSEEGPSESMENLSVFTWPLVIAHNMKRYGPQWLKEMSSIISPFLDKFRE